MLKESTVDELLELIKNHISVEDCFDTNGLMFVLSRKNNLDISKLKEIYDRIIVKNEKIETYNLNEDVFWFYNFMTIFSSDGPTEIMRRVLKTYLFQEYLEYYLNKDIKYKSTFEFYLKSIKEGKILSSRTSSFTTTMDNTIEKQNWKEITNFIFDGNLEKVIEYIVSRCKLGGIVGIDYFPKAEIN